MLVECWTTVVYDDAASLYTRSLPVIINIAVTKLINTDKVNYGCFFYFLDELRVMA